MESLAASYLSNKFKEVKDSPEHPIYHPEGVLGRHIMLVCLKAFLWAKRPDFIWAALLHDLFKADSSHKSQWVELPQGKYWSNPMHPEQAKSFILSDGATKYFIYQTGGDWRNVAGLCQYHMAVKAGGSPKGGGLIKGLSFFPCLDDMINRYTMPEKALKNVFFPGIGELKNFTLSGYKILKDKFLLTGQGEELCFSYELLPEFFSRSKEWGFLEKIFKG